MTRALVVERRALAPRKPRPDPIAEILAAAALLQHVPRESTASMPDMLFHNRRVAKRITEAAGRLEVEWEPRVQPRRSAGASARMPAREQRREITVAKGRRVRVIELGAKRQMELAL